MTAPASRLLRDRFPEIAKEYSDDNEIPIDAIKGYSGRQVTWICSAYGHKWNRMSVSQRTRQGQGCPYCSNRRLLTGFNDLMTRYPEHIKAHWDFSLNTVSPRETYGKSGEEYFWLCDKGHSYRRTIHAELNNDCGICSSHRIQAGVNDASSAASHSVRESWSSTNPNPLAHYGPSSGYNGLWVCPKGHEYRSPIARRVKGGGECPVCMNRLLLAGFNDLVTCHPDIAAEFDDELNGLRADEVISGSATKYWWRCAKNPIHTWQTTIALRISQNNGCPHCRESRLEREVAQWVRSHTSSLIIRSDRAILNGLELDIVVPDFGVAIEVNGIFWHSDQWVQRTKGISAFEYHSAKRMLARKAGLELYFVWEDDWGTRRSEVQNALLGVFSDLEPDKILTTLSKG